MSWISRTVGDEDAVEVVGRLVNRVVEGQASHARTSGDDTADDVLFHSTVNECDVGCLRLAKEHGTALS